MKNKITDLFFLFVLLAVSITTGIIYGIGGFVFSFLGIMILSGIIYGIYEKIVYFFHNYKSLVRSKSFWINSILVSIFTIIAVLTGMLIYKYPKEASQYGGWAFACIMMGTMAIGFCWFLWLYWKRILIGIWTGLKYTVLWLTDHYKKICSIIGVLILLTLIFGKAFWLFVLKIICVVLYPIEILMNLFDVIMGNT